MADRIDTKTARLALKPRPAPYFKKLSAGCFLGFRRLERGQGTWVARWRDPETGKQTHYQLGEFAEYSDAEKAARAWFDQCEHGSAEIVNVETACRRYVEDRRREKGEATAIDAEGRFRRLVYETKFGRTLLHNLRTAQIVDWRNAQVDADYDDEDPDAERRAKDSTNRNLATLKAALNLAYRMGLVGSTAQWDRVASFSKVGRRRERFLTMTERKQLIAAASPALTRLLRAVLLTAARPGELAAATVGDLDPSGLLTLDGKTGRRVVPLSAEAFKHLKACAGKRDSNEPLLTRIDGNAWSRYDWRDAMTEARTTAGLPDDVVLYNVRHAAISEMVVGGLDLLTVARIAGTSVAMIQRHYGHMVKDGVVSKLDKVKML